MKRTTLGIAAAVLCVMVGGALFVYRTYGSEDALYHGKEEAGKTEEEKASVGSDREDPLHRGETADSRDDLERKGVFVCGAVRKEGVCYLEPGARVIDAITAAGGFSEEADTAYLNLAAYVYDGQRIYVPKTGETVTSGSVSEVAYDAFGRLDLNLATEAQLMKLPGIGEKRAADIIAYRESVGRFASAEEIKNVSGIKDAVYENIKDKIFVR